jgi:membrane protease YdiL (CAAX protease family)
MTDKKSLKTSSNIEVIFKIWGWVLLIWSLYRYFFKFSEPVDEFIFKPLVFVVPVLWYVFKKEKRTFGSIGLTSNNFLKSLIFGLSFGLVFFFEGVMANSLQNGKFSLIPINYFGVTEIIVLLILTMATSLWEEILNRGFLFNRIFEKTKNLPYSVVISSVLFILLHVPILVTSLKLQGMMLILFFMTNFILALTNCILFYNTGSIVAPVLVHLFWNMTVSLYL